MKIKELELIAGVKQLSSAVQSVRKIIESCDLTFTNSRAILTSLVRFDFNWISILKKSLASFCYIFENFDDIISNFKNGECYKIGIHVGNAMMRFLHKRILALGDIKREGVENMKTIFIGFLEGNGIETNRFNSTKDEKKRENSWGYNYIKISQAFENLFERDRDSAEIGLKLFGEATETLVLSMGGSLGNSEKLIEKSLFLSNPTTFSYNSTKKEFNVNGVNIWNEVESAIEAYQKEKWQSLGYHFGTAMTLIYEKNKKGN